MSVLDWCIFAGYMVGILGIGWYHFRRNETGDDYYVGGRNVPPAAVGLSIVATDVGGGFSIGLGGVGFLMGLSGTWLLFTGLVGAWLSAVFIIPRIKGPDVEHNMLTYPDFLRSRYGGQVALVAAVISGVGYLLFTAAQIRAGATLASETMFRHAPFGLDPFLFSLVVMGVIIVGYTVLGGIKAVIYTDFVQWIVLLSGLALLAIPLALYKIGGFEALYEKLPERFFSLGNISIVTFINWMVTIIPIWLVGMTLYQRMFACKGVKEARKAWYIAGLFEYPLMAFVGVFLGMCGRALFPELPAGNAEQAVPRLINHVLPIGAVGVVVAAYFSAIMSTADSCIMASSGNIVNDLIQRYLLPKASHKTIMRISMFATLVIGAVSMLLAGAFSTVLGAVLYAYDFLVSGLFVPTLGAFFWRRSSTTGAMLGMICGGTLSMGLIALETAFHFTMPYELDPVVFGMVFSAITFVAGSLVWPDKACECGASGESDSSMVEPAEI